MGVWSRQGAVWTLAGDGELTSVVARTPASGNYAVRVQWKNITNLGRVLIRPSPDGRSGFEISPDAVPGNLRIRRLEFGTAGPDLASGAHTFTAAQAYTLEVRLEQNIIRVRVNGSTTNIVSLNLNNLPAGSEQFEGNDFWGFAAAANGTKVLHAELVELVTQTAERADVLVAVGGGEMWLSDDGLTIERVGTGPVMRAFGDVDICEHEQTAIAVDGANLRTLNVATRVVGRIVPTAGLLPGQTSANDGRCSATLCVSHVGRLMLGGMKDDSQNIVGCAVNELTYWQVDIDDPGSAFGFSATDTAKIGQPVRSLLSAGRTRMSVGAQRSFWDVIGDPTLGAMGIEGSIREMGSSGKDSMAVVEGDRVAAHGQAGLVLVPQAGGEPAYISRDVLTTYIQLVDALESYRVSLVPNAIAHGTHVFLTAREELPSVHIWYDELVGKWQGGRVIDGQLAHSGGFFPWVLPERVGPTAAAMWNGDVVMYGRDGYIYGFDDTVSTDDGDDREWVLSLGLMADLEEIDSDAIVSEMVFQVSDDTEEYSLRVYGGMTAEEVYDTGSRWLILETTIDQRHAVIPHQVRAPCLLVVLSGTGRFELEVAEYKGTRGPMTRHRREVVDEEAVVVGPPLDGADFPIPETVFVGYTEPDDEMFLSVSAPVPALASVLSPLAAWLPLPPPEEEQDGEEDGVVPRYVVLAGGSTLMFAVE